ncbi:MAG: CDP-diacylglycerol--glycerol-3-phosphate 3-phosphatidyltransferase [Inquilinaceae bacterium]
MFDSLPNLLTLSRILCIPVLVGLLFVDADWARWVACGLFAAAAITDFLDGYLARRQNIESPVGKMLDPIADKMLVAATLLALAGLGALPGLHIVPAIVILLREMLIGGMREFLAGLPGGRGLPVSSLAKWKTTVQMAAILFLILDGAAPTGLPATGIGQGALWLAAVLTVITGYAYVVDGFRQIAERPSGN